MTQLNYYLTKAKDELTDHIGRIVGWNMAGNWNAFISNQGIESGGFSTTDFNLLRREDYRRYFLSFRRTSDTLHWNAASNHPLFEIIYCFPKKSWRRRYKFVTCKPPFDPQCLVVSQPTLALKAKRRHEMIVVKGALLALLEPPQDIKRLEMAE